MFVAYRWKIGLFKLLCVAMLLSMLPFVPAARSAVAYAADGSAPLVSGPIKIATVGDSITAGSGASSGNSYPAQLQRLLGTDYLVNNYGLSGSTLLKNGDKPYWNQTQYTDSKAFLPDIVIIQLGTNDAKSQNWAKKDQFLANYKELITIYKNLASHPAVYVALPPKVFGNNTFNINGTVLKDEITPLVQQAASETNATIIDNYVATKNLDAYFPDKVHPNDTGAFALAYNVYRSLGFPGTGAKASFYGEINYGGGSVTLPGGAYTAGILQAAGMTDKSISSLKVAKGSLVAAYENGDFTGGSWMFNQDKVSLGMESDNKISSLRIIVPGEPVKYEAELLTAATSNGTSVVNVSDSAASGGIWVRADLTEVGQYVEYTVNVPAAGTYHVVFRTKAHPWRPIFKLYIEGKPYGPELDGYYPDPGIYKEMDVGDVTFASAGNKTFRFQITGQNAQSTGWYVSTDYIQLTPKPLTVTNVAIAGEPSIGEQLMAKVTFVKGLNDANAADFKYQWYRNGSKISGATAQSYTVAEADRGKALSVVVTARDVIGAEGNTITSASIDIAAARNKIAMPAANPAPGTYTSAQKVALTSATEGASIYFTTDGSNPTAESTLYTGEIDVKESKTIKAIAVKDGMEDSNIAEFKYTILSESDPYAVETAFNMDSLQPNETLAAKVKITNHDAAEQPVLVIVALYNSNEQMVNLSFISKVVAKGSSEYLNAGFKLPANVEGHEVRVLIWNGADIESSKMNPLANVTTLR
ncbi:MULTISPECIES: chitobiase/beta-hexosaminidase C-terminal domain-containing protein [unclassified Paenibacillus]|uniref:chitobiase/beta-hexosaminidase C-terminal domain-containing protein n=1 Tax=unclassified Paenibacillus TaxID=185978 RepID=UPI00364489AC